MSRLSDKIGQFTTIPNSVIRMWPQIGVDGMALFVYLRYRTNSETEVAFPAYTLIQADTGLTRRRIAIAIRALEKANLLSRVRRFGASTIYSLTLPLVQGVDYSSSDAGLSLVQGVHTNKIDLNKTDINKIGADAPKPEIAYRETLAQAMAVGQANHEGLTAAIEREFHISPDWNTKTSRKVVQSLKERGATCAQFRQWAAWYRQNDWRGKAGQAPTLALISELWPQAFAAAADPFAGVTIYE